MGMLESELSAKFSPISQLSAKFLANSQLTVNVLAESQLSVNPYPYPAQLSREEEGRLLAG